MRAFSTLPLALHSSMDPYVLRLYGVAQHHTPSEIATFVEVVIKIATAAAATAVGVSIIIAPAATAVLGAILCTHCAS